MNNSNQTINVQNVTKKFKIKKEKGIFQNIKSTNHFEQELTALNNVSFFAEKGEIIGIIGMNGSGKTTLLRIISGVYEPTLGIVSVNGRFAPLLQIGTGFHNELIAHENIMMYGMLLGLPKNQIKNKIDSIIEFAELQNFTNLKLKYYSAGMRARLGFSIALQVDPDILLVDEVLSVGDIAFRKKSLGHFISFKKRGKTIIYSSHNLDMITNFSDKVIVLHQGRVHFIGEPSEAVKKYRELSAIKKAF